MMMVKVASTVGIAPRYQTQHLVGEFTLRFFMPVNSLTLDHKHPWS